MIDLKLLEENLDKIQEKTRARNADFDFDLLTSLSQQRREAIFEFETLRSEQKKASQGMRSLKPGSDEFNALRASLKEMSDRIAALEQKRREAEEQTQQLLMTLPNPISDHTPLGDDEEQNVEVRRVGEIPTFDFEPQDHVALGEALRISDHERAAKISGARFTYLMGAAAKLHRALAAFMLDVHTQAHGYQELYTPYLWHANALEGTGQLPKYEEDLFKTTADPYLIRTAELPLTHYMYVIICYDISSPIRVAVHTPCFRSEARSHSRDRCVMIRQHYFANVEVAFTCLREHSAQGHQDIVGHA